VSACVLRLLAQLSLVVFVGFIGSDSHQLDEPSSSRAKLLVDKLGNRLPRNCQESECRKMEKGFSKEVSIDLSPVQLIVPQRQGADRLAGDLEDGVTHRWGNRQHAWLADVSPPRKQLWT
jgi:hypothetical protein